MQSCRIWKINLPAKKITSSVELFRDLKNQASVEGFSNELSKILNESIRSAFLKSKWYDPEGKATLNLSVTGEYKQKNTETPVHRLKTYTVLNTENTLTVLSK